MSPASTVAATPSRQDVDTWLAAVRADLERVGATLGPLLEEQGRLRAREALLLKLLQSFDGGQPVAHVHENGATEYATPDGSIREYIREHARAILREHGPEPMHINDLHAQFLSRGYRVPGAGRPANLTAHLGRCDGIVSPTRGFYTLAPAGGEKKVATAKPRRRRRRVKRR